jgi:CRISPR type III-A/MTUBE-associated protein Csm6
MSKTILFSPVGGTDPISSTNYRDGSMLHICRVYQPDEVVLYMSQEMLKNQEKDDRYRYCLDHLQKLQNFEFSYHFIERPQLKEVQEFDYFYQEFRQIIECIFKKMDDSDQLLLNISSGTPAMKSGLLVLKTLGEFPCKAIQVVNPERKIGTSIHDNYDVETLWELNEDNSEDFENRCREVQCPTLSAMKAEEVIKKHILVYDYQAAVFMAETLSEEYTEKYLDVLKMAELRLRLDFKGTDNLLKEGKVDCIPVKDGNGRKSFEYALSLDIKLRRKEYADFVRAITPLIVDLFEMVLKKQYKIDINDYCRNDRNGRCWADEKLEGTEILKILKEEYKNRFKGGGPIYSDHLKALIRTYSNNRNLIQIVEDLRQVESSVRNLAAHQVVSIDDTKIKTLTGFTGQQIFNKIKAVFSYTGLNIKGEYWESYDEMNKKIIELIG